MGQVARFLTFQELRFNIAMTTRKYFTGLVGQIEFMFLPGKAIVTFNHQGENQRGLLWVKNFVWKGSLLLPNDSLAGKLSVRDTVYFDCHVYDNRVSQDDCKWYVTVASKDPPTSFQEKFLNQTGYITEVDAGAGVITFTANHKELRVFFLRSRFYIYGKRLPKKKSLHDFISEDDGVQFEAEKCEPKEENHYCSYFATLVWRGSKPENVPQGSGMSSYSQLDADDETSERTLSTSSAFPAMARSSDFPSLVVSTAKEKSYKAYELVGGSERSGKGNVLQVLNQECGLALWPVQKNMWESVFFHRSNTYLFDVSMRTFDLQDPISDGCQISITAVPAVPEFPCKWIAHRVVIES